tara:strand:+ start:222 stop:518 length:297 start_codon:yes stop_codon:yes gene_type:complete
MAELRYIDDELTSRRGTMFDSKQLNDIVENIVDSLPEGLKNAPEDIKQHLRDAVNAQLTKLDIVTREEFDVQMNVLKKTRTKVNKLEKQIAALQQKKK